MCICTRKRVKEMSSNQNDSWFTVGVTAESLKKAKSESSNTGKSRLWMPKGQSKRVVILDDEPFCFWEHNPKINGKYKGNWFICRHGMPGGCPLCNGSSKRYYIGFVTVIDVDGFTGKNGESVKNFRLLLPMKLDSLTLFAAKKERKTSLVNAMFELTRTDSDKSPGCGNDWDFLEYVDPENKDFWYESRVAGGLVKPEPFEYRKIFVPLSVEEMMNIGNNSTVSNSNGISESGSGGDGDQLY